MYSMKKPNKVKRKILKNNYWGNTDYVSNHSDKTEFSSILKKLSHCVFKYWFFPTPSFHSSETPIGCGRDFAMVSTLSLLCFPSFCSSVLRIQGLGHYLSPEKIFIHLGLCKPKISLRTSFQGSRCFRGCSLFADQFVPYSPFVLRTAL